MRSKTEIQTKDGTTIGITIFSPDRPNGKVMILAPTGGVTQEFYHSFATYYKQMGYVFITFDYRGVGRSAPVDLKGYKADMHQWAVQDIDSVILHARNQYPMQEIIYIGHCVGGEIVGLSRASQYINKLVLVNSALSCRKLWPLRYRFRLVTMNALVKLMNRWFGYFPGKKVGYHEDLPADVMTEWSGWCGNSNGLFDQFPDQNYRRMQIPILAFSFSDNWNTPKKAVKELLNRFSNAFITWHHLTPAMAGVTHVGHYGFFDPSQRKRLWKQLHQWIQEADLLREPA